MLDAGLTLHIGQRASMPMHEPAHVLMPHAEHLNVSSVISVGFRF
jgi:hypothetical protein